MLLSWNEVLSLTVLHYCGSIAGKQGVNAAFLGTNCG